jgi:hypothetical protein
MNFNWHFSLAQALAAILGIEFKFSYHGAGEGRLLALSGVLGDRTLASERRGA